MAWKKTQIIQIKKTLLMNNHSIVPINLCWIQFSKKVVYYV